VKKKNCQLPRWELSLDYNHAKSAAMQFPKFENPHNIPLTSLLTTDAT
jgi:hypothetical protein